MNLIGRISLPFIVACAALAPVAHADSVKGGKGAAEQCVKYQHARSDKQIASCCADMLDGVGGKQAQQECVKTGKEMANGNKGAAVGRK
jgi:hypothetical protein